MGRLAVVGKHETLGEPRGTRVAADIVDRGDCLLVFRHGLDAYVPPHRIDHAGHMRALAALGCDRVLALSSVGALRPELAIGTFVVPDDFIALDQQPVEAAERESQHVVPGFTPGWRARVLGVWRDLDAGTLVETAVYWQANGPRFETPAEIRMLAAHADVVGMTAASECVAANQVGLEYAAVCVVDNVANGLGAEPLTPEVYARGQASNRARLLEALDRAVLVLSR